jgi:hypothetical protein
MKITSTILVTIALLCMALAGCQQSTKPTNTFKMTASQVCQYVNQYLGVDYEPMPGRSAALRYRVEYNAVSATAGADDGAKDAWSVNVKVRKIPELYSNSQWANTPRFPIEEASTIYYFYENSGSVTKK